ncbi:hypothetical protein ACTHGU_20070 [Chitinophagaceae bacterium MMS25-I14]
MKYLMFLAVALCSITIASAQKARDVLEDGIVVKENQKIFLSVTDKALWYACSKTPYNPHPLGDSAIFLPRSTAVNVYMAPLNPLNYSITTGNQLILDPIDEVAAQAYGSIIGMFDNVIQFNTPAGSTKAAAMALPHLARPAPKKGAAPPPATCNFDNLIALYNTINMALGQDKKADVAKTFSALAALDFKQQAVTVAAIGSAKSDIDAIKKFYSDIDGNIKQLSTDVAAFKCDDNNGYVFIVQNIFNGLIRELKAAKDAQYKRVTNLDKCHALVAKAAMDAAKTDGIDWCVRLDAVPAPKGKLSVYTVTVNTDGYVLSADNEIVAATPKQIIKQTIIVRRFQRFVPEVAAGVAYTLLSFPKYGTTTDSLTGKQYVSDAGTDIVKRLNVSVLLNYNYFIPNSLIHPFIQLGVGANADFPTLLAGGGIRFNFIGKGRISLSTGVATSFIKTLDKLKVGDEVTGSADVEKDLKYQLAVPKMYFGIQYNF